VINRIDRDTLARYGVRTRLAGAPAGSRGALIYDDRAREDISSDRIWAVNAAEFARYVVETFERDGERIEVDVRVMVLVE